MASLLPLNEPLGKKRAAHLLRRATFGPSLQLINQFQNLTPAQAVAQLTVPVTMPMPPIDREAGIDIVQSVRANNRAINIQRVNFFRSWWMERMRFDNTLVERMTYFLHTHFTTRREVVNDGVALYFQNQLFRYYALGNFKDLTGKISLDNAMLIFLDGRLNEVGFPNENYGRELLELYSIGKGDQIGSDDYTYYTEQDVQEAARVLSGYKNDPDFAYPDPDTGLAIGRQSLGNGDVANRHDAQPKTFSDKFGGRVIAPPPETMVGDRTTEAGALDELEQLKDMIFNEPATAKFICTRLYRFFCFYEIPETGPVQDYIEGLTETFYTNNYELLPVLTQLLTSQHFYELSDRLDQPPADAETDDPLGAIIKSPLEVVIHTLRAFDVAMPDEGSQMNKFYDTYIQLIKDLDGQGMDLYNPIEVAGYPAYHQFPGFNRNWISAVTLLNRYSFGAAITDGLRTADDDLLAKIDAVQFVDDHISDPADARVVVNELIDFMFPEEVRDERRQFFLIQFLQDDDQGILDGWTQDWNNYKSGADDDTTVRPLLENLFAVLIASPEYQLF